MTYQQYFDQARAAGFSGGSALTIAAIAMTQGGTFDFKKAYGETLGGTDFSVYSAYKNGSYVKNMPNNQPWVPYNSANWPVAKPSSEINPQTKHTFQVNQTGAPTPNKSPLGKPQSSPNSGQTDQGNVFQQAAGAFNKWRGDVGKEAGPHPTKNDQEVVDAATGGFWKDIKDAPSRALKVIVGVVFIGSSLILLLLPPAVDVVSGTLKSKYRSAVKTAVFDRGKAKQAAKLKESKTYNDYISKTAKQKPTPTPKPPKPQKAPKTIKLKRAPKTVKLKSPSGTVPSKGSVTP